jgi:hypothetical protein
MRWNGSDKWIQSNAVIAYRAAQGAVPAVVSRLGRFLNRIWANWCGSSRQVSELSTRRRTSGNGGVRGISAG